jgi:Na+/phosphate symporter
MLAVEAQLMASTNNDRARRVLVISMVFELLGILLATWVFQCNQQFKFENGQRLRPLQRVVWITSAVSIVLIWVGMIFLAAALLL